MYFSYIKNKIQYTKGLTLLETLVSITIISITIIGPLSYIATSSSYARQAKEALVATYLAEEIVELVQNQYDSMYVYCLFRAGVSPCIPDPGESSSQTAWRVFKTRFSSVGGPSCFSDESLRGCSFDYRNIVDTPDIGTTPSRYDASADACSQVVARRDNTTGVVTYVCKGVPLHTSGGVLSSLYKRNVYLDHLPTFEGIDIPDFLEQDYDDIRVTAEVSYRAVNGSTRMIKIVRYIHPHP